MCKTWITYVAQVRRTIFKDRTRQLFPRWPENFQRRCGWVGAGRRRGAAQGGAVGGDFGSILDGDLGMWSWERREGAGNRSQILLGSVGDACGTLVRVSVISGLQKSAKNRER